MSKILSKFEVKKENILAPMKQLEIVLQEKIKLKLQTIKEEQK